MALSRAGAVSLGGTDFSLWRAIRRGIVLSCRFAATADRSVRATNTDAGKNACAASPSSKVFYSVHWAVAVKDVDPAVIVGVEEA